MRVNPYSPTTQIDTVKTVDTQRAAKTSETDASTKPEGDGVARSGEFSRLLGILNDLPDIRDDVVSEALARHEAGEHNTPQATQETADLIAEING